MKIFQSHTKSSLHYKVMMDTELNYNLTDASHVTYMLCTNKNVIKREKKRRARRRLLAKELANKNEIYSKNVSCHSHVRTEEHDKGKTFFLQQCKKKTQLCRCWVRVSSIKKK